MSGLLTALVACIALCFGPVVLFGAPYLPSKKRQIQVALDLLALKPGQRLLDLGAGDGSVALAALARGLRVTAIELNPILCFVIFLRTMRHRKHITIKCGNFWHIKWGEYDAVYVFLLDRYMKKLDNIIVQQNKACRLASFAFMIPGRKPYATREGVFLYRYSELKK